MKTFEPSSTRPLRVVLALLLALLACNDPQPGTFLWEEEFETECMGSPCGWSQTSGTEGRARWAATTLHPGEHALVIEGNDVEVRGPGGDPDSTLFNFSTLEANVVGRCDPGASLEIVVGLAQIASDGTTVTLLDETRPATLALPAEWGALPTRAMLTATSALRDGGIGGIPTNLRITTVVITKSGPGLCEIANIVIDDVGLTTLDTGSHC